MSNARDIPQHEHQHSLYLHCLDCGLFGTPLPAPFATVIRCGNCNSLETVRYYPTCCIIADRAENDNEGADDALLEAAKKIGW